MSPNQLVLFLYQASGQREIEAVPERVILDALGGTYKTIHSVSKEIPLYVCVHMNRGGQATYSLTAAGLDHAMALQTYRTQIKTWCFRGGLVVIIGAFFWWAFF